MVELEKEINKIKGEMEKLNENLKFHEANLRKGGYRKRRRTKKTYRTIKRRFHKR